jgi:hypothetical protein
MVYIVTFKSQRKSRCVPTPTQGCMPVTHKEEKEDATGRSPHNY